MNWTQKKFLILLAATCAAVFGSASAHAVVSCSIGSSGVAFGTYNPTSMVDNTSTGSIDVACDGTLLQIVGFSVSLSAGNGTMTTRKLVSGASNLGYNLYLDPAYMVRFGDGTMGSQTTSASFTLAVSPTIRSITVYGKLPAGQTTATVGTYSDTLIMTVTF